MKIKKILILLLIFVATFQNVRAASKELTVEEKLSQMTIEEKIGQMLFVCYSSSNYIDDFYDAFKTYQPAGFIIYRENETSSVELKELITNLQNTSKNKLYIGIDQEGGYVQRLTRLNDLSLTNIPSMEFIGTRNNPIYAYQVGTVISSELRYFGININFSPDVDLIEARNIDSNYERYISSDPNITANMAQALVEGLNANNIISCPKHFPGIGSSTSDTHYGTVIVTKPTQELLKEDLIPYKYLIENNIQFIMLSHAIIQDITNDKPITISKEGIDFLRNTLNYQNIIITDALNMGAMTMYMRDEDILIEAINAGVDLLLVPPKMSETVAIIKKALETGKIKDETIDKAVTRILTQKENYFKTKQTPITDLMQPNSTYNNLLVYRYPWKEKDFYKEHYRTRRDKRNNIFF